MSSDSVDSASGSASKRRELRRRKILANPEERLKKLLGYGSNQKVSDDLNASNHLSPSSRPTKTSSQVSVGKESTAPNLVVEEAESIKPISDLTALASTVHGHVSPDVEDEEVKNNDLTRRVPSTVDPEKKAPLKRVSRGSKVYDDVAEADVDWPQGVPHPLDRVADCGELPDDESTDANSLSQLDSGRTKTSHQGKVQSNKQLSQSEEELAAFSRIRQLLFLVVGILVRFSFLFSFGQEYVQSLFNPFVALEIAVLGYQRALGMDGSAGVRGGLWMSALMMSGIRPDIIQTYKSTMGAFSAAADDFTVYFFAFVCLHLLLGMVV